jgi:hypothetical protein
MGFLERHEQGIVIQPGGIFHAKRFIFSLKMSGIRREMAKRLLKQGRFPNIKPAEVHFPVIPGRHIRQVFTDKETFFK